MRRDRDADARCGPGAATLAPPAGGPHRGAGASGRKFRRHPTLQDVLPSGLRRRHSHRTSRRWLGRSCRLPRSDHGRVVGLTLRGSRGLVSTRSIAMRAAVIVRMRKSLDGRIRSERTAGAGSRHAARPRTSRAARERSYASPAFGWMNPRHRFRKGTQSVDRRGGGRDAGRVPMLRLRLAGSSRTWSLVCQLRGVRGQPERSGSRLRSAPWPGCSPGLGRYTCWGSMRSPGHGLDLPSAETGLGPYSTVDHGHPSASAAYRGR